MGIHQDVEDEDRECDDINSVMSPATENTSTSFESKLKHDITNWRFRPPLSVFHAQTQAHPE